MTAVRNYECTFNASQSYIRDTTYDLLPAHEQRLTYRDVAAKMMRESPHYLTWLITKEQYSDFMNYVKREGLKDNIILETEYCTNANYRKEQQPRLKLIIMKGSKNEL